MSQESGGAAAGGVSRDAAEQEFESIEKAHEGSLRTALDRYIESGNAADFIWHEPYILESFVLMYEATKNIDYMETVKNHADDIFAYRADNRDPKIMDEVRNCDMPGWLTPDYPSNPEPTNEPYAWLVHQGMICYPIARWVHVVMKQGIQEYQETAKTYLENIIDIMWHPKFEEEVHNAADGTYYDNNPVYELMVSRGYEDYKAYIDKPLAFNMLNAPGRALIMLYLITNDTKYRDRAAGLANFLKSHLRTESDTNGERYVWNYRTDEVQPNPIEDLSHGAIDVDFAYLCHEAGIVFDDTDMTRLVNTFRYVCHGASGANDRVDGSGDGSSYGKAIGQWMHLGYVDTGINDIYWDYYQNFKDNIPWSQGGLLSMAYLAANPKLT